MYMYVLEASTVSQFHYMCMSETTSKLDLSKEDCGIDKVVSALEMAEDMLPKLDIVLKKKIETMETKLDNLGSYVKWTLK